MDAMDASVRPLAGLRVLELAQNLAGPYCVQILSDLGADVIKIERPGGDAARAWGPPFVGGSSSIFAIANRGKRSVELDIAAPGNRDTVRALIEWCDVLVEAFRPGALAALGFDYDTARSWNERIIYCSVLAYGAEGPLRMLPGYDPLMQAHAGIMSVTGDDNPARVGTSVVDMGTGMWLALGLLAALRKRDATGDGSHVTAALYDTALAWNAYHLAACIDADYVPRPMGTELPMIAPYGAFPTRDGELMIAAANDGLFTRLCTALDLHDVLADARYRTNPGRVGERAALNAAVAHATARYDTAALLERLRAAGVPCAPIQDMAQVASDAQTAASGMIVTDDGGTTLRLPLRIDGVRPDAGAPAPEVGAHTAEVLQDLEDARQRAST